MISIEKYREYNPNTETILRDGSGSCVVIDRYGADDYGAWWTDEEHLYDDSFGSSVRGTLSGILDELKPQDGIRDTCITFADVPLTGSATATHNGRVIWTNHLTGDCPPDVAMMHIRNVYTIDGELVFDLVK